MGGYSIPRLTRSRTVANYRHGVQNKPYRSQHMLPTFEFLRLNCKLEVYRFTACSTNNSADCSPGWSRSG